MMRKFTLLFVLMSAAMQLSAQITVTNASWPVAGDTVKLATDYDPQYQFAPAVATNGNWDFSGLQENNVELTNFLPASQGSGFADFPNAELYSKSDFGEIYYNITNAVFEIQGYKGDILGFGFPLAVKGKPASVERRNPMKYFDIANTEYTFGATFSAALLPDSLLSGFPITPDSVRFGQNVKRLDVVDSWGKLKIPLGTYDVLREKRTSITTFKIEVKAPVVGWIDVSTIFGGEQVKPDTAVDFHYIANGSFGPIMVLNCTATGDTIRQIDFKTNSTKVGIFNPSQPIAKLDMYPNPASSFINVNTAGIAQGQTTLVVCDLFGRVVREEKEHLTQNQYTWFLNLDNLDAGMYFVSLRDNQGKIKAAGTFSVVRK